MVSRAASSTLEDVRSDCKDWQTVGLEKLLRYLCEESVHFRTLLLGILAQGRLSLILYCDGLTPGSALTNDNKRKSDVWYASFLEFGTKLCHEELWFTLASATVRWVKKVPAGLSGLTRTLLRDLFFDQDISGKGICIEGSVAKVHLHGLLADEEALNAMLYIKGASGLCPCAALCSVVNKPCYTDLESGIRSLTQRSPLLVDISCGDVKRIGCKSDADVWEQADQVAAAAKVGKTALQEEQKLKGMNYHEDALLFDLPMRTVFKPASMVRNDPMHILFSNGLMGSECMRFLNALKLAHGFYFKELREFLQTWRWQCSAHTGFSPADCFNEHREDSSKGTLKLGATELLQVYPGVRHFIVEACSKSERLVKEIESFFKLCEVCDLVLAAMHCRTKAQVAELVAPLENAVSAYMTAFVKAYGPDAVRFKHHQLLHVASQLLRDGMCLTCFTLERKHITTNQCFNNYRRWETMPAGSLARMVNAQVHGIALFFPLLQDAAAVSTAICVYAYIQRVKSGVDRCMSLCISLYIYIYIFLYVYM